MFSQSAKRASQNAGVMIKISFFTWQIHLIFCKYNINNNANNKKVKKYLSGKTFTLTGKT